MVRLLFDFPSTLGGAPMRRAFRDPIRVVRADSISDVMPVLEEVRDAVQDGLWAAGYVAYEAAPAFDPAFRVRPEPVRPLLWFGLFDDDGSGVDTPGASASTEWADVLDDESPFGPWERELTEAELTDRIRRVRDAIEAGETYQVNLTTRMSASLDVPLASLYDRLRAAQGAGYHALLELDDRTILSASPELFFRLRGREVTTRPMKGTSPRGRWLEEDRERARDLRDSEKEQAENRMIVDLIRNDLGRICRIGSVEVVRALEVERYRTVLQMTSTIRGRLEDEADFVDVFGALFPCGSVTGAPKIHTTGLIADLEASPRDVYCGAIGFVEGGTGDAFFNVPIRTLWHDRSDERAVYGVGSGVTWSSTPAGELAELRDKARILDDPWPAFSLLESLRLEGGRILRRERHLSRMAESAEYFGRPFPAMEIRRALDDAATAHPEGSWKLRLLLDEDGGADVTVLPLEGPAGGDATLWRVEIAGRPVRSTDPFLFHKTTHREVYESRCREHPGADDVILVNEEGRVTEFTRGNVVALVDGDWVTPPRSSGLLAGCFRQELLDEGAIRVGVLTVDDLHRADQVRLINSVRGWVPVELRGIRSGRGGRGERREQTLREQGLREQRLEEENA